MIVSPLLALMRNQIDAAERAGIRAVTDQLGQHRASGRRSTPRVAAGRGRRAAGQPGAAEQPGVPRPRCCPSSPRPPACSWSTRRTASPTGATTSGPTTAASATLLADLPDGIPVLATTATANERVDADVAEQLGRRTRRARRRVLVLRGSLDRSPCAWRCCGCRRPSSGSAGWPSTSTTLPGSGHHLLPHRRRRRGGRRAPARARARRGGLLRADRDGRAAGRRGRTCSPTGSRRWSPRQRARHGLRQARPRRSSSTSARRRRRSPTTSRSAAPAAASTDAEVVLLPRREDRDIWKYFASLAFPPGAAGAPDPGACSPTPARPLSTAGARDRRSTLRRTRLEMMLKVLDVDGAVRRVQGGWTPPGSRGPTTGALRRVAAGPGPRAAGDARLPRAPTGCRMEFLRDQLDDPERRSRAGAATTAAGWPLGRRSPRPRSHEAERAAGAARRRARAPQDVADRLDRLGLDLKGKIDDAAEAGRAVARLTDLGYGQQAARAVPRRRPRRTGARAAGRAPSSRCSGDWRPQVDAIVVVESRRRPHADPRPRRRAERATSACRWPGAWRSSTRPSPPGQGAANSRPAGGGGRTGATRLTGDLPVGRRCCSSTT